MDSEAELRHQFIVWLENCRLQLAVADSREQLQTEMIAVTTLLAASRPPAQRPTQTLSSGKKA